ncbi:myosin-binding protein C, cardiac-type-like [Salvelinus sp. IW2-2015]|uniref:myosin-binding protein C, cardiac-type-like n=1 Tax=Salvelinus sp. IW2-2015 TaxID=2691554 RepID=UPI000CDFA09F|nr:myosin-binding protein C, cardiac-type-like [Salvelinus alpinus]
MPEPVKKTVSAFAKKPKTQVAEEGATVVFETETEKPDAKVRWQSNTKDLASGDKYVIKADGNKHSLTIQAVTNEDGTAYAVIAGGSKVKFDLKVKEKEVMEEVKLEVKEEVKKEVKEKECGSLLGCRPFSRAILTYEHSVRSTEHSVRSTEHRGHQTP